MTSRPICPFSRYLWISFYRVDTMRTMRIVDELRRTSSRRQPAGNRVDTTRIVELHRTSRRRPESPAGRRQPRRTTYSNHQLRRACPVQTIDFYCTDKSSVTSQIHTEKRDRMRTALESKYFYFLLVMNV